MRRSADPFTPSGTEERLAQEPIEYEHSIVLGADQDIVEDQQPDHRLHLLTFLTVLAVLVLSARLVDLQIVQGSRNQVLAEGNRVRSREIRPPRGKIFDRSGTILASNQAAYTLEVYPAELPRDKQERATVLRTISDVTGLGLEMIEVQVEKRDVTSLDPIILANQIDRPTALLWKIKLADIAGVDVATSPQRTYASLPGLGHLLGYIGKLSPADLAQWPDLSLAAYVGKTGVELSYEEALKGIFGEERIEVDAQGRIERVLAEVAPVPGEELTLHLDAVLQERLVTHLEAAAHQAQSAKAAAVVMDVETGGILALASLPTFDSDVFIEEARSAEREALLTNTNQPLLNRVTSGSYPTGSTIKPVIATGSLEEGLISSDTRLDTSAGVIEIGQWRFPDWKVHGVADVRNALAESNDIFFYALGGGYQQISGLGLERMEKWLHRFGFGTEVGIDLPTEVSGLVPSETWKEERFGEPWYIGDSYHLAIGQGFFLATPLQLTTATAAIANGGRLYAPTIVARLRDPMTGQVTELAPRLIGDELASADTLAIVREGMRQTVTQGTARSLGDLAVPIAGKTGTAQFETNQQTHSWFTGFAPADDPEIAFTFLVEGGGESSDAAVPAAKAFLTDWITERSLHPPGS